MSKHTLSSFVLALSTLTLFGCAGSRLPSASASESADEKLLADLDAVELDGTETTTGETDEAVAPHEMEVSWQDNGQPIRPMSGPGRGLPLKPPVSTNHTKGSIVSEEDKVPAGSKRKDTKNKDAKSKAAAAASSTN